MDGSPQGTAMRRFIRQWCKSELANEETMNTWFCLSDGSGFSDNFAPFVNIDVILWIAVNIHSAGSLPSINLHPR